MASFLTLSLFFGFVGARPPVSIPPEYNLHLPKHGISMKGSNIKTPRPKS